MQKMGIIRDLANRTGYRQSDIAEVWNAVLECIEDALIRGESVHMKPLGHLVVTYYKGRKRVLPQFEGDIECAPTRRVKFQMSEPFMRRMRETTVPRPEDVQDEEEEEDDEVNKVAMGGDE